MFTSGIAAVLIAIGPMFPNGNQPVSRPSAVGEHLIISQQPVGYDDPVLLEVGRYLVAHGYSRAAAAGVAGCVAGESGGNPESVGSGGGLIQWTPLPPGLVTDNPEADLQAQLPALLRYNERWSQYLPELNAQTDAVAASDVYSQDFERPAVLDSDTRPVVAEWVYKRV